VAKGQGTNAQTVQKTGGRRKVASDGGGAAPVCMGCGVVISEDLMALQCDGSHAVE